MDLEETVKELKVDLKNAKELISCLAETVKAQSTGRDEDLHRKMDELLYGREKLASEIQVLKDEMKGIAEDVKTSKELANLLDTVQTTQGYVELFVNDFEKIQMKQKESHGVFEQMFTEMRRQMYSETSVMRETLEEMGDLFVKKAAEIKQDMLTQFEQSALKTFQVERKFEVLEGKLFHNFNEIKLNMKELFQLKSFYDVGLTDDATQHAPKAGHENSISGSSSFFPFGLFAFSKPEPGCGESMQTLEMRALLANNFNEMRKHINREFEKYCDRLKDTESTLVQKLGTIYNFDKQLSDVFHTKSAQLEEKIGIVEGNWRKLTQETMSVGTGASDLKVGEQKKAVAATPMSKPHPFFTTPKAVAKKVKAETSVKEKAVCSENTAQIPNQETQYKCRNCSLIFPTNLKRNSDGFTVKCPNAKCGCANILIDLKEGYKLMKGTCGHLCVFPMNTSKPNQICQVCSLNKPFVGVKNRNAKIC